jgi:hypothetical protein
MFAGFLPGGDMDRPGKDPGQLRQQGFGFIGVKHRQGQITGLVRGQAQKPAGIFGVQHDEIVGCEIGFQGEALGDADGDGGDPLQYQMGIRLTGGDAAAGHGFAGNRGLNRRGNLNRAMASRSAATTVTAPGASARCPRCGGGPR